MDKMRELENRYNELLSNVDINNLKDVEEERLGDIVAALDEIQTEANEQAADMLIGASRLPNGNFASRDNIEFDITDIARISSSVDQLTDRIYNTVHALSVEKTNRLKDSWDALLNESLENIDVNNLEEVGYETLRTVIDRLTTLRSMVTSAKESGELSDNLYDNVYMNNFVDEYLENVENIIRATNVEERLKTEQAQNRMRSLMGIDRQRRMVDNQISLLESQIRAEEERLSRLNPSKEEQLAIIESQILSVESQIALNTEKLNDPSITAEEATELRRINDNDTMLLAFYRNERERINNLPELNANEIITRDITQNSLDDLRWRIEWLQTNMAGFEEEEQRLRSEIDILKKGGNLNPLVDEWEESEELNQNIEPDIALDNSEELPGMITENDERENSPIPVPVGGVGAGDDSDEDLDPETERQLYDDIDQILAEDNEWEDELDHHEPSQSLKDKVKGAFIKAKEWLKTHWKALVAGVLVGATLTGAAIGLKKPKEVKPDEPVKQEQTVKEEEKTVVEEKAEIVDVSALESLIDKCEKVKPEEYTKESYDEMKEQLDHAKEILNSKEFTQETIDIETKELQEAYDNLVKLEVTVEKDKDKNKGDKTDKVDKDKTEPDPNKNKYPNGQIPTNPIPGGNGPDNPGPGPLPGPDNPNPRPTPGPNNPDPTPEPGVPEVDPNSKDNAYLKDTDAVNYDGNHPDAGHSEMVLENPDTGEKTIVNNDGKIFKVDANGNIIGEGQLPDGVGKDVSIDGEEYFEIPTDSLDEILDSVKDNAPEKTGDEQVVTPPENAPEQTFDEIPTELTEEEMGAILGESLVEPASVEPASVEPAPVESAPVESAPVAPVTSVEYAPVEDYSQEGMTMGGR